MIPRIHLLPIVLLAALGVWSAFTIRFQTELFPLFPQQLRSVRGLKLSQESFAADREVFVVIRFPAGATAAVQDQWVGAAIERLRKNPAVEMAAETGGQASVSPEKMAAWVIARLPSESFEKFRQLIVPESIRARLQETRQLLGGAADPELMGVVRRDPLRISTLIEQETGLQLARFRQQGSLEPSVRALVIRSKKPLIQFEDCQRFVRSMRDAVALQIPGAEVFLTGRPAFVAETSAQMKTDMIRMILLAAILVSAAFWIFYRSLAPLGSILLVQILAVLAGLSAARLFIGELNVLSMGFAAILLGVGMDYSILVYHHHLRHDAAAGDGVWRTLRRSIWLSAFTTAGSFAILIFSSFPGLRQMALLVAIGLLASAWLATGVLPGLLRSRRHPVPAWMDHVTDGFASFIARTRAAIGWGLFAVLVAAACLSVWNKSPLYSGDLGRLQPSQSEAHEGQRLLAGAAGGGGAMAVVEGESWQQVRARAMRLGEEIGADLTDSLVWIPNEKSMSANREAWIQGAGRSAERMFAAGGFDPSWSRSTLALLSELDAWSGDPGAFRDIAALARSFTGAADGSCRLLVRLPEGVGKIAPSSPALPVSWEQLKEELSGAAHADFQRLSGWMLALVIGLCAAAHRSARLVALNMLALASALGIFVFLLLSTATSMTLLSLMTVPLLIGLVVDYSLHILTVLEHQHGDLKSVFRHLALPIFLTGLASMIGFGAPMVSRQPALQNFGFVMDLGILAAVATGLVVLPAFYRGPARFSSYSRLLYRAGLLEMASRLGAWIGLAMGRRIGRCLGMLYCLSHPRRRQIVRRNVALLGGGRPERVFSNYGATIADYLTLGRLPPERAMELIHEKRGLEHLEAARAEGKGALIVTAHLSLFELGGLLLTQFGFPMSVLTLPEPSRELSQWRARYRKRWGIGTLEVGEDDFSFLNIIKELQKGGFVAALADRPYRKNQVLADFPGGRVPFSTGPVAISLLARCPIIPGAIVTLPSGGYRMEAFAPIRPAWRPEGRDETLRFHTLEIARALKPALCQHAEQWYQFVALA